MIMREGGGAIAIKFQFVIGKTGVVARSSPAWYSRGVVQPDTQEIDACQLLVKRRETGREGFGLPCDR